MQSKTIIKYGLATVLTSSFGFGLIACSAPTDETQDSDVTTTETTDSNTTSTLSSTPNVTSADEKLDDEGEVVISNGGLDDEGTTGETLPTSGWTVDKSDPAQVVISDPEIISGGERKVSVGTAEGVYGNNAQRMANNMLTQAAPGLASARVDEQTVDGRTWYVFTAIETGGTAYYDKDDGDIQKIGWTGCTFDEAKDIFLEYESWNTGKEA